MAPVPKAAERLRSETLVLLPSQCSCMPVFGPCRKTEGKSTTPIRSRSGSLVEVPVEQRLGRVEGVEAAGAEGRLVVDEVVEAVDDGEQPLAHHADADELERQPVDEVELDALGVDLGEEAVGAEALVDGGARRGSPGRPRGRRCSTASRRRSAAGRRGPVRTLPAWQPAQLRKMRSMPHGVAERGADRAGVAELGRQVGRVLGDEAEGGPALVLAARAASGRGRASASPATWRRGGRSCGRRRSSRI